MSLHTPMINRRTALKQTALTSATLAGLGAGLNTLAQNAPPAPPAAPAGPFTLPSLPYPVDALEPAIDAQTMEIHHGKHHAAYVAGLNKAVAGRTDLASQPIEALLRRLNALPEDVRTAVRNHGGGHANHSLFWLSLKKGAAAPTGELAKAIEKQFGGLDGFQKQFTQAAMGVFGSGWAWLTLDGRTLRIESLPNQDSPLSQGRVPLLGLDVWEHAYYLKYQNRRADYVAAFFATINWEFVAGRYREALA
jgi:Fe-Mn family superoxide dismutase